ncbi:hypothetical protein BCF53_10453 [Reinekea marinisedimentorum]|uniref:Sulfotransferase family protein n=2 Tax=Reinekea marinisedimentorum TaxID=230495 RepID=A0A4V2UJX8_9GAMM|nr:hypothetical protein BCF53_10453 [Reinekea marinisedimentorum]
MPSSFEEFKRLLDESVGLIEASSVSSLKPNESENIGVPDNIETIVDTNSLLVRCEQACQKHSSRKPTIRIIHHLACSGGTLISKCMSAMPNVFLLSEVHPYSDLALGREKPKYSPSDIVSLSKYASVPNQKTLAKKIFKQSIDAVFEHVHESGGHLVLRDHTHSDFNVSEKLPQKSVVSQILSESYDVKSILTIRNPIDAYASLVKNNWVHFSPKSFEEYCRRFLVLVSQFSDDEIFLYEDFTAKPHNEMMKMTEKLNLPYDESFDILYPIFRVTGDSGRSSNIIGPRSRRQLDEAYQNEIKMSESFPKISAKFGFN